MRSFVKKKKFCVGDVTTYSACWMRERGKEAGCQLRVWEKWALICPSVLLRTAFFYLLYLYVVLYASLFLVSGKRSIDALFLTNKKTNSHPLPSHHDVHYEKNPLDAPIDTLVTNQRGSQHLIGFYAPLQFPHCTQSEREESAVADRCSRRRPPFPRYPDT
jgi:hypothetical protein